MPAYTVGKTWSFKEHNYATFHAGDPVDLDEAAAANYMRNEPGLLAPARMTTQARPDAVRTRGKPGRRKKA
jgi:hypothetical protein